MMAMGSWATGENGADGDACLIHDLSGIYLLTNIPLSVSVDSTISPLHFDVPRLGIVGHK